MKRSTLSRSRRCSSLRVRSIRITSLLNYFTTAVFFDGRMKTGGIDDHAEFLQIMCMTELMQPERLIDRGRLAHHIDRPVDGFLGHLQRERGFCGDLLRQRDHEGRELGSRADKNYHARA